MNRGRFGRLDDRLCTIIGRLEDRLDALIGADEPPASLVERTQALVVQQRRGLREQHRLLGEALEVLETGGYDRAAQRLGHLRVLFAFGPSRYGFVIPAVLPGPQHALPPAGER